MFLLRAYCPNLCPSMQAPLIMPACLRTSQPVNLPSSSKDQSKGKKVNKDRTRLNLILLSYTKLFPKLIEKHLIKLIHLPPLKPPFPKWYKVDARCDYHTKNPKHSLEHYNAFKYKVQEFVQVGKVRFEKLN